MGLQKNPVMGDKYGVGQYSAPVIIKFYPIAIKRAGAKHKRGVFHGVRGTLDVVISYGFLLLPKLCE